MILDLRFGIIGDPHIGLPHTIWDNPSRFHLIEVSIPALEQVLDRFVQLDLDFILMPGDLTQHGERENHKWLSQRLSQLPMPVYVVPGNHDVIQRQGDDRYIGLREFPQYYQQFGYDPGGLPYYCQSIVPGLRIVGLNSNQFDAQGHPERRGSVDPEQLAWLQGVLAQYPEDLVLLMIHHNVLPHLPDQGEHPLGQRYLLANSGELLERLPPQQVPLIFTGHLHVQGIAPEVPPSPGFTAQDLAAQDLDAQDLAAQDLPAHDLAAQDLAARNLPAQGVAPQSDRPPRWEITTGSLVSFPHPYRIAHLRWDPQGEKSLTVESPRIEALPQWPQLQDLSRQWMADRSDPFMGRLLTGAPLNLSETEAQPLLPDLRYFWGAVANGDPQVSFPHFPKVAREFFHRFNHPSDRPSANQAKLPLGIR